MSASCLELKRQRRLTQVIESSLRGTDVTEHLRSVSWIEQRRLAPFRILSAAAEQVPHKHAMDQRQRRPQIDEYIARWRVHHRKRPLGP